MIVEPSIAIGSQSTTAHPPFCGAAFVGQAASGSVASPTLGSGGGDEVSIKSGLSGVVTVVGAESFSESDEQPAATSITATIEATPLLNPMPP
jgi:hypothetical protein